MVEFTTCVALDFEHLAEWSLSWPTWAKNRPELLVNPLLIMVDDREPPGWWASMCGRFVRHPDVTIVPWPKFEGVQQRHRMLSSLVYGVAEHCKTDWYLKIDTDCACKQRHPDWPKDEWFLPREDGRCNAFISHRWGYTKPAQIYLDCCEWAKGIPELAGRPEVPGRYANPLDKARHARIISFVLFGSMAFLRKLVELAPGPVLPAPSQDTFLWYVAHRLGWPYARTRMDKLGWVHSRRKLQRLHDQIMMEK